MRGETYGLIQDAKIYMILHYDFNL